GRQPGGELDRRRPADLRDPEPRENALERPPARLLDRGMEVLGALPAEPLEALEILDAEPVEVAATLDESGLQELLEDLPAGALDIHPAAADEMLELLGHACRTGGVRAVMADRALVPDDRRVADRTALGQRVWPLRAGSLLDDRADDLGDHVARLLEDDVVADQEALATDLV